MSTRNIPYGFSDMTGLCLSHGPLCPGECLCQNPGYATCHNLDPDHGNRHLCGTCLGRRCTRAPHYLNRADSNNFCF